MIPTMMKPMTGDIFSRANAGITIPAAPRIVSALLSPCPPSSPAILEVVTAALPLVTRRVGRQTVSHDVRPDRRRGRACRHDGRHAVREGGLQRAGSRKA